MKALFHILVLFLLAGNLQAQEFVATKARLSKEAIGKITSVTSDHALIQLNPQNDQFSFSVKLLPILTTAVGSDSIVSLNKTITLTYNAEFPLDDLDFYDSGNNGKQYAMDGQLTVNNVTRPVRMKFYMEQSMSYDNNARDISGYPVRINFALEINPAEYGLDLETANFTEKITVMVENGVINRSNSQNNQ